MDLNSFEIQQRYDAERHKRLRPDGLAQNREAAEVSHQFISAQNVPLADFDVLEAQEYPLKDSSNVAVLIVGAGYSGLLFAIRLLEAGFKHKDIIIADIAGGFGGTWYWNQYPGLMCDAESYIYMPLLEELRYIPTAKYVSGLELRHYAETIADRYHLRNRTIFYTKVETLSWREDNKFWQVCTLMAHDPNGERKRLYLRAQFVILATGLFVRPKLPRIEGLDVFQGHLFHASRWDYGFTGGSPEDPVLHKLKDKRVGIIGTGATAVQVIPVLAQYAKELVVFQRTPASVDRRKNQKTDLRRWEIEVATAPGWQNERRWNFNHWISNIHPQPIIDMVSDATTQSPSFSAFFGAPGWGIMDEWAIQRHQKLLTAIDFPRQERIRARVRNTVTDHDTAESLQNWYPSWCKRPIFHDDYLSCFNRANVTLVDTHGCSLERLTTSAVVIGDDHSVAHEIDCLIFATGYTTPSQGSPGSRAGIIITGRGGVTLNEKYANGGPQTLHGVSTNGFPNLFWPGSEQAASDFNHTHVMEHLVRHIVYIICEGIKQGLKKGWIGNVSLEVGLHAERRWTEEIVRRATSFTVNGQCTPSYFNNEGETVGYLSSARRQELARRSQWGDGLQSYVRQLENWRESGFLRDIIIGNGFLA
ncbi:monooxygenase [Polychaeton citri CBS 116435]|uniref:Monooxygenase n=1 Tax=Polychaeton citri CBS 116435 TaxID=1314669 RepID=A0A9P4Q0P3_9PEZI|nr:monooxygenase [Polychaeton citri CBS 116435]